MADLTAGGARNDPRLTSACLHLESLPSVGRGSLRPRPRSSGLITSLLLSTGGVGRVSVCRPAHRNPGARNVAHRRRTESARCPAADTGRLVRGPRRRPASATATSVASTDRRRPPGLARAGGPARTRPPAERAGMSRIDLALQPRGPGGAGTVDGPGSWHDTAATADVRRPLRPPSGANRRHRRSSSLTVCVVPRAATAGRGAMASGCSVVRRTPRSGSLTIRRWWPECCGIRSGTASASTWWRAPRRRAVAGQRRGRSPGSGGHGGGVASTPASSRAVLTRLLPGRPVRRPAAQEAASVVIMPDGWATVGESGSATLRLSPALAVRQNLALTTHLAVP